MYHFSRNLPLQGNKPSAENNYKCLRTALGWEITGTTGIAS